MGNVKTKRDYALIEFLEYIQDGNLDEARRIYDSEHPDNLRLLQNRNDEGQQAIHLAAYYGFPQIVHYLLPIYKENGLNIDTPDNKKLTPLMLGCMQGIKIMNIKERNDVKPEARNEIVHTLIQAGCNVNYKHPKSKLTPLHWASKARKDPQTVRILIEAGARVDRRDLNKFTPLDVAGKFQNHEITEILLGSYHVKAENQKRGAQSFMAKVERVAGNSLAKKGIAPFDNEEDHSGQQLAQGEQLQTPPPENRVNVRVRYSDEDQVHSKYDKYKLRVMIWAATYGKLEILESLIQEGFSPFIRVRNLFKRSPFLNAVNKNKIVVVQSILTKYNYVHPRKSSVKFVKKYLKKGDLDGNTALHLAYTKDHRIMISTLERYFSTFEHPRNNRGWLPSQMSHSVSDLAIEPEYVIIAKKKKAKFLIDQLSRVDLIVSNYTSMGQKNGKKRRAHLAISVDDDTLDKIAEEMALDSRLLAYPDTFPFHEQQERFFQAFPNRSRQACILYQINKEVDLNYYQHMGIVKDHFPLHTDEQNILKLIWSRKGPKRYFGWLSGDYKSSMEALNFTAHYHGEKVAWYFAWLSCYSSWLIFPSCFGLAMTAYMVYQWEIDNRFVPIYCILLSIWITFFNQYWRRRQSEIAYLWNMTSVARDDAERTEFDGEYVIDKDTEDVRKRNMANPYLRTIFVGIPFIGFSLAIVVGTFVGFRLWYNTFTEDDTFFRTLVTVANGAAIAVLNTIYKMLAIKVVNWENHRYQEEWENSLVIKNFTFQFANSYLTLFWIAFFDQDFSALAYSMGSILIVKQFALNLVEIVLPAILNCLKQRKILKLWAKYQDKPEDAENCKFALRIEQQKVMSKEGLTVMNYSEMVIQLGFVTMFAPAFPLAPLFALINNTLEFRGELYMNRIKKRNRATGASGIGAWLWIIDLLSIVSVIANCGILFFTSTKLQESLDFDDPIERFYIVVLAEHGLILLKMFFRSLIPDTPAWVTKAEEIKKKEHARILIEMDKELREHPEKRKKRKVAALMNDYSTLVQAKSGGVQNAVQQGGFLKALVDDPSIDESVEKPTFGLLKKK